VASNFPAKQQTGADAELAVAALFQSWGWTWGRDWIDAGYDLCIEPQTDRYHGARFLVQVKGTAQKKPRAGLVAPVDKTRLRQYCRNPHPVFLIRAAADGRLYWLHVQEWARANRSRLSGDGQTGIRMDASRVLSYRDAFEAYLDDVLAPAHTKSGALSRQANARERHLSSIDPKFLVKVGVEDGHEVHEIHAREQVETDFNFTPVANAENLSSLREAMGYGLARAVEVENFSLSGSPLFDELGISRPHKGTLRFQQATRRGRLRVYAGPKFSIASIPYACNIELSSGQQGFAFTTPAADGLLQTDVRGQKGVDDSMSLTVNFRLDQQMLTTVPIRELEVLGPLSEWVDQVHQAGTLLIETTIDGQRAAFPMVDSASAQLETWLGYVRTLSRLHLVAKALNSDLVLPKDYSISEYDVEDVDLAYALLKGERIPASNASMQVQLEPSADPNLVPSELVAMTTLVLSFSSVEFAELPVAIDLPGYVLTPCDEAGRYRVHHPEGEPAWLSYKPDGRPDSLMRRNSGRQGPDDFAVEATS